MLALNLCRNSGMAAACTGVMRLNFSLLKVLGALNPADMLTKVVTEELILRHLGAAGFLWESGRASSAPRVDGFSLALEVGGCQASDPCSGHQARTGIGGRQAPDPAPHAASLQEGDAHNCHCAHS